MSAAAQTTPRRQGGPQAKRITPELAARIYAFAMGPKGAGLSHRDIARRFGVNPGRVSEIKGRTSR